MAVDGGQVAPRGCHHMTRSIDALLPAYRKRAPGMAVFFGDAVSTEKKVDDIQRHVRYIEVWGGLGVIATVLGALYVGRKGR